MMKTNRVLRVVLTLAMLVGLALLVACKTPEPTIDQPSDVSEGQAGGEGQAQVGEIEEPTTEPTATEEPPTPSPPTDTPEPTPTPVPPTPTESGPTPLPPEPQEIQFQAEDGFVLQGRYYPAAVNPAPMIVLMHWAPGDKEDWNEIAFWLQNRGLSGTSPNLGQAPWLDPAWFPPMIEGQSFAVFTFTFRNCEGGCANFERDGWRADALAALQTARQLEGVDPARISSLGASIGADGPVIAGAPFNIEYGGFLGALSLSPGGYLGVPYSHGVDILDVAGVPVHCFYAVGDGPSAQACKSASGEHYQAFEWEGSMHGMELIRPEVEPKSLELILDFLKQIYGLE